MAFTKEEVTQLIENAKSGKVKIYCQTHNYVPGAPTSMPMVMGCVECCKAELFHQIVGHSPIEKIPERLDQMAQLIHHMAEAYARGEDFELYDRPILEKIN